MGGEHEISEVLFKQCGLCRTASVNHSSRHLVNSATYVVRSHTAAIAGSPENAGPDATAALDGYSGDRYHFRMDMDFHGPAEQSTR